MQLAPIHPAAPTSHVAATAAQVPTFTGGIDYEGTGERFRRFSAHATDVVYGASTGYASLQEAIDAVTMLTVGTRQTAAGIYEQDGRFHARQLDNTLTFGNGATWTGQWRLEQYPADRELLDGRVSGVTRTAELRAIVDGAERHVVDALPVA